MKKFAIAVLMAAGSLFAAQAHAGGGAVIGAVDGALAGSYFGGAHGAVAGAIIGAAVGNSIDHDRDYRYGREVRYASAPVYYAPQPAYRPYYAPSRVVYDAPVYSAYDSYPVAYPVSYPVYSYGYPYAYGYRGPVYSSRYAAPYRVSYARHGGYNNHGHSGHYRR